MKLYSIFPMLPVLAFVSSSFLAMADMPADAAGGDGSRFAGAVSRTVRALIEYTKWPDRPDPLVVCQVGQARHAAQLGAIRLTDGWRVSHRPVSGSSASLGGCQVLYIGNLPLARQRQLTAMVRGRGVLTIAEDDLANGSEAMVVLTYQPQSLSFRLNIDAVSRSGLHVDPRVLRVARGGL